MINAETNNDTNMKAMNQTYEISYIIDGMNYNQTIYGKNEAVKEINSIPSKYNPTMKEGKSIKEGDKVWVDFLETKIKGIVKDVSYWVCQDKNKSDYVEEYVVIEYDTPQNVDGLKTFYSENYWGSDLSKITIVE